MAEAPHGTYGLVDTRREPVTILPAGVSDDTAPLIRMAKIGMTALRLAPPTLGESVLVFGLGLVGLFAGRLFRLSGARPVIGTDLVEFRLDKAWEAGLIPLHGRDPDLAGKIKTLTGGRGADIVVEATGSPGVILSALESAADGGRVVLLGSPRGKVELDPYSLIHRKGVSVIGSHERMQSMEGSGPSRWDRKKNQEVLAALFASGDILTAGYVTDVIAPKDVPAMYETLAASPEKTLGVLIDWSRGLE
jgi:threonine dehydrogenase-like Zn-dependent dehydrogenase